MEDAKNIFKSKTFWVGILAIVIGLAQAIQGQLESGGDLTIMGMLTIILRLITTTPIKF